MLFISLQKLFLFSRKSNFRLLDIQISWQHQTPQQKQEICFTKQLGKYIVWKWNLASLCHIKKEKKLSENFAETGTWKPSSRPSCVCKELGTTSIGKWSFWSKLPIHMSQQTYQILSKSACRSPQFPFYRGLFENWKGLKLVYRPHFS